MLNIDKNKIKISVKSNLMSNWKVQIVYVIDKVYFFVLKIEINKFEELKKNCMHCMHVRDKNSLLININIILLITYMNTWLGIYFLILFCNTWNNCMLRWI